MKKIKQIIWDLAGETAQKKYMYAKLRKSDDYRRLLHAVDHQESVCPARRVFLLDTPGHGNLGDHAIVIAMRKFMQAYFPEDEIYEFTFDECTYCMEKIAGKIRQNDLLLIPVAAGAGKCTAYPGNLCRISDHNISADIVF